MAKMLICCWFLTLFLWGCAAGRYETVQPQYYPGTHKSFDVTFGWKKTVTATGIAVNGYARNTRYPLMQDLELILTLLDSRGKEKGKKVF